MGRRTDRHYVGTEHDVFAFWNWIRSIFPRARKTSRASISKWHSIARVAWRGLRCGGFDELIVYNADTDLQMRPIGKAVGNDEFCSALTLGRATDCLLQTFIVSHKATGLFLKVLSLFCFLSWQATDISKDFPGQPNWLQDHRRTLRPSL